MPDLIGKPPVRAEGEEALLPTRVISPNGCLPIRDMLQTDAESADRSCHLTAVDYKRRPESDKSLAGESCRRFDRSHPNRPLWPLLAEIGCKKNESLPPSHPLPRGWSEACVVDSHQAMQHTSFYFRRNIQR